MGTDKLWLDLQGTPVVGHTWRRFDQSPAVDRVVLVIRDERRDAFQALAKQLQVRKEFELVEGGKERQDSVWNGLMACPKDCSLVAIQDAARPCTDADHIQTCYDEAAKHGAVVAGAKVTDTLKRVDEALTVEGTVDREGLWSVQTPQVFQYEVICRALEHVRREGRIVTDDTAACEAIGFPVKIIPGEHPNPKVTYPGDLPYISWLLANPPADV